jgi:hypothetical protein
MAVIQPSLANSADTILSLFIRLLTGGMAVMRVGILDIGEDRRLRHCVVKLVRGRQWEPTGEKVGDRTESCALRQQLGPAFSPSNEATSAPSSE